MYCPSCGSASTPELSYCNRCGASLKLIANQIGVTPTKLVGAAWAISVAITLVTLGGFGMIFGLVMALITRGVRLSDGGIVLVVFSLMSILAIVGLLVRQLSRVLTIPQLPIDSTPAMKPSFGEKPAQQISPPGERDASVTEHTTRTFEPIYRDRNTQR